MDPIVPTFSFHVSWKYCKTRGSPAAWQDASNLLMAAATVAVGSPWPSIYMRSRSEWKNWRYFNLSTNLFRRFVCQHFKTCHAELSLKFSFVRLSAQFSCVAAYRTHIPLFFTGHLILLSIGFLCWIILTWRLPPSRSAQPGCPNTQ